MISLQALVSRVQLLWLDHRAEVIAAIIIGIVAGVPLAAYFALAFDRSPAPAYNVYIVTDPLTDTKAEEKLKISNAFQGLELHDVKVMPNVLPLSFNPQTNQYDEIAKAQYIVNQGNALLVIGNFDSGPTENSLATYFTQQPPIPFIAAVQTDDDLLRQCKQPCYGESPAPLLQLSPINSEQAQWAVKYAVDHEKRQFLIVRDNDSTNEPYTDSLIKAYHSAISSLETQGFYVKKHEVKLQDVSQALKDSNADVVLYAGGLDDGSELVRVIKKSGKNLMVILSDSTVKGCDIMQTSLKEFGRGVEITNQSNADFFCKDVSVNAMDSAAIAAQLIKDLENHGFDWRFRVKAWFDRQTVEDARRNLVRVMRENIKARTSYLGATETAAVPGGRSLYAFSDGKRVGGIFHVWQWDPEHGTMSDVDRWHPQSLEVDSVIASKRQQRIRTVAPTRNTEKYGIDLAAQRERISKN
jgi:hypothetical protein